MSTKDGTAPWSDQISHGELLRLGCDETRTLDPQDLHFLYQGMARGVEEPNHALLPYRLALLSAAGCLHPSPEPKVTSAYFSQ